MGAGINQVKIMKFINQTQFPAFAFSGVKPEGTEFHVVALRQTLTWDKAGQLFFANNQNPLCETDEPFDSEQSDEIRQEFDLCPYKPRCDVIVNASAYPPAGKALQSFEVRLRIQRPGVPAPLPPKPHGLNPFMPPSPEQMAAWRAAVEQAKCPLPGEQLLEKTLNVTGERYFVRRLAKWELSEAQPVSGPVPLRLTQAFGGQCEVEGGTDAAEEIARQHHLSSDDPDAPAPTILDALAANPIGCGFARQWFLDAMRIEKLPAPRIEFPSRPLDISVFNQISAGRFKEEDATALVAGLGVRPRGHPDRVKLIGMVDNTPCIDFAFWNAAWPDQQVAALAGDEIIELTNLSAPSTAGLVLDGNGNSVLRLKLPGHLPSILAHFENGTIGKTETRLDTVVIDTEVQQVSLVWRATLDMSPEVHTLEVQMPDQ